MKKIYVIAALIILITTPAEVQGQDIENLEKFIILDAKENAQDITPHLLANEAFLSLYRIPGEEAVYFANAWPVAESMSYGIVYDTEFEEFAETDRAYARDEITFYWKYQNTYDEDSGTAKVRINKIYKPQGTYFEMVVIPEDLDLLVYKGYVEGTLNLAVYDQ